MGERRGMKALELWCKRVTDGYQGVKVENMTTSWRDGLAFCAIIHHFRPDLIDFGSLNKADIYRNNELAFRTAEIHLGIPALLDAEDMVECSMPDRLSILTYLSQFYQTFAGSRQSTSPNRTPQGGKRPASPSVMSPTTQTPPTKMATLGPSRREPCAKCHLPVFIAERLLVGGRTLYHRTCFRCARCEHQLSVANCYETEDGQYCCETCPDEVEQKLDIEDTRNLKDTHSFSSEKNDSYSADFESVLESSLGDQEFSVVGGSDIVQDVITCKARTDFMIGQLQWTDEEVTNPYLHLSSANIEVETTDRKELCDNTQPLEVMDSSHANIDVAFEAPQNSDNSTSVDISSYFSTKTDSLQAKNAEEVVEQVPLIDSSIKCSDSNNQPLTANDRSEDCLNDQNKLITTCTKESDSTPTSIVKMRMKMFDADHSASLSNNTSNISFNRKSLNSNTKTDKSVKSASLPYEVKVSEDNEDLAGIAEDDGKMSNDALIVQTGDADKENICNEISVVVDDTKDNDKIEGTSEAPVMLEPTLQVGLQENEETEVHHHKPSDLESDISVPLQSNSGVDAKVDVSVTEDSDIKNIPQLDDNLQADIQIVVTDLEESESKTTSQEKSFRDIYPSDLNPFGDDDIGEAESEAAAINLTAVNQASTNPFGSSDEEEETETPTLPKQLFAGKPPRPPQPLSRQSLTLSSKTSTISPMPRQSLTLGSKMTADVPSASLNPFWSEGEEPSSDEETQPKRTPVPLPRTTKSVLIAEPSPVPRLNRSSGQYGSGTSLSSTGSSANSTMRQKKKPAPPPPLPPASTHPGLITPPDAATPTHSVTSSPRTMPRHRKARPAPPPPDPLMVFNAQSQHKPEGSTCEVECEKNEKDEENRTRQTRKLIIPTEEQSAAMIAPNKSTFGQWKRKKGPAPPRPVPPQRREIRVMPMKEVKRELDDIDVQQLELERQGVKLEKTIRAKFEQTGTMDESGVTPDVEDLVLQLFEIVNEKNELFRKQAELMYLRRQHRLEEEHADLEYEIRCLLMRPEHTKTDSDKAYEEELIQRLVDVVERRNEIVNCLEMDRRREVEEDRSIHHKLASFAAKGKGDINSKEDVEAGGTTITHGQKKTLKLLKKKVKKSKEKHTKKKEKTGVDSDKDIDESDSAKLAKEKKTKKKWF